VVEKERDRFLAQLPEPERSQVRWEHVGSTSIKVTRYHCCGSIRIHGSMPLTNGSGPDSDPDPAIFVSDLQEANKKQIFLKKVFLLFTFSSFFIDKKTKRSRKTVVINVFLTIFA
jgi:hypothetical protein